MRTRKKKTERGGMYVCEKDMTSISRYMVYPPSYVRSRLGFFFGFLFELKTE